MPCAEFLSLRSREFVQAAHVLGHSHAAIVFREILPNALAPLIVLASLMDERVPRFRHLSHRAGA